MHHNTVVLVQNDEQTSTTITNRFVRNGWTVQACADVPSHSWDLAVIDCGSAGIELCNDFRAAGDGYIIVLGDSGTDEATLAAFANGADDYIAKPFNLEELVARVRAGLRVVGLQKALIASNRQLERLSLTDSLTQLWNRRAFDREIALRFEQARRYERPLSVAVVDVDCFKRINDEYGHQAGDSVLRAIAQILETTTRSADFVARFGGEEFAVILTETGLDEARQFGEKIRNAVALSTIRTGELEHDLTISVGVASIPYSHVENAKELVYAADLALYRAKDNGRNCVQIERRREPTRQRAMPAEEEEAVA